MHILIDAPHIWMRIRTLFFFSFCTNFQKKKMNYNIFDRTNPWTFEHFDYSSARIDVQGI